jgi:hypothetical protein
MQTKSVRYFFLHLYARKRIEILQEKSGCPL